MRVDLMRENGAKTPGIANPVRLSKTPIAYDRAPPTLGSDSAEVLGSLGLGAAEIAELTKAGVVG
jgi:formyl-CoA transferase